MNGFCECGCGGLTPIATETDRANGRVKGQPKRFINGHNGRGRQNPNFNGGLSRMRDGRCVIVGRDGSTTYFYRAVMEAHLGRTLGAEEIVHHINEDPTDDRLENLEIVTRARHAAIHADKLQKARRSLPRTCTDARTVNPTDGIGVESAA